MQNIYIIFLIIIFGSAFSYIAYKTYQKYSPTNKNFIENSEYYKNSKFKSNSLLLFYANWCPHSKEAMAIWKEIQNDNTFKKYNLSYVDIDGENKENKLFLKEFNIKEYPTIILLKNNKKYIFDAKLEKNRLSEFLKAVNNL